MITEMVKGIINNTIENDYPHLKLPNSVYVKITKANKEAAYYSYEVEMLINGTEENVTLKQYCYTYNLKILKEDKVTINEKYAEIPNVKSYVKLDLGDIAAALLMYGKAIPFIVGKVI